MRVLLIEDDPNLLALWGEELRKCGVTVCSATSFIEARALLMSDPVDLAVVDLCVDKTGWRGFVLWLQQSCPEVQRVIVAGAVLCAENDASTLQKFGTLLPKPVDLESLMSACELLDVADAIDLRLKQSG